MNSGKAGNTNFRAIWFEWVNDCCLTPTRQFFSTISWREQVNFQCSDEVRFVLDQHARNFIVLDHFLKQRSTDRHVASVGHIILIPSQPVFALSPKFCAFFGEATDTNFVVFCLTRSGLEPTIYRTRDEHANHYTIDAVFGFIFCRLSACKPLCHSSVLMSRFGICYI
jgi:hypothetical protein